MRPSIRASGWPMRLTACWAVSPSFMFSMNEGPPLVCSLFQASCPPTISRIVATCGR